MISDSMKVRTLCSEVTLIFEQVRMLRTVRQAQGESMENASHVSQELVNSKIRLERTIVNESNQDLPPEMLLNVSLAD